MRTNRVTTILSDAELRGLKALTRLRRRSMSDMIRELVLESIELTFEDAEPPSRPPAPCAPPPPAAVVEAPPPDEPEPCEPERDYYVGERNPRRRGGAKMRAAAAYVAAHPGCDIWEAAVVVGPHGSKAMGYETVQRAVAAGLIASRIVGGRSPSIRLYPPDAHSEVTP